MKEEIKEASGLSEEKEEMNKGRQGSGRLIQGLGVSATSTEDTSLGKNRERWS